ncbi:1-(5-phosphoribosyl)-5-[(5-phosphoribosylamino)methylideneamino]imidazole-4-carboxamide isomerase [Clostridiisalibacter paucivorans]|uniref:1-(5-phosphoribosyl)-5-[(5- phosphoribosylamino)methylideneamino]imidazole-4- carboxamide isomerase n=1 Tax=Clostridiisalibacter paucivorans TaxID=408753 RepID=UPI00047BE0E4|nr:1-(5-phosphoribosyl)-5-[(5-phosphoribosylamino)methylideneamino]imidazole-4-carboxamide isomerase [Clostridiisalibacter paucivorans]
MIIYPAIDIKDGKCVRLKQGKFKDITIYNDNPVQVAKDWEKKGAKYIHIVDLDGALKGKSFNREIIKEIILSINIPIQIGGGIRTLEDITGYIDMGADKVIIGTKAIEDKRFLNDVLKKYRDNIVISIDAKDGLIAAHGWTSISSINAVDFIVELERMGIKTVVYTDISKDGMMKGPNFEMYSEIMDKSNIDIVASGGVSTIEDVFKLREMDVYGCIIGKALYNGNIDFECLNKKIGQ